MYGDETIKNIAVAMKSCLGGNSDIVARYGGEEFITYLPGCDFERAKKIASSMNEKVRQLNIPHIKSEVHDCVTISIGIVTLVPGENIPISKAIAVADKALYSAKESGRNCFKALRIESKSV